MRIGRAMADASQTSRKRGNFLGRLLMLLALSFAMVVQPAMAQSVLRDAETEAFFRDMSRPLKEAAGLQPDNVQIVLLHSDDINAFVAGGQVVYVFSGLVTAARSEEHTSELQSLMLTPYAVFC